MDAYGYVHQNPIRLIDPTGMSAEEGPIFDENYNQIGHDGKNDGQAYIVTGSKADEVKQATSQGQYYGGVLHDSVPGVITVPKFEVFQAMDISIANTLNSGSTPENQVEFGGNSWKDNTISHWGAGTSSIITNIGNGTGERRWSIASFRDGQGISLFRSLNRNLGDVKDVWHVHPSGSTPSTTDLQQYQNWNKDFNVGTKAFTNHAIILGASNSKINFYKVSGTIKEFDYNKVKNISTFAKAEAIILNNLRR